MLRLTAPQQLARAIGMSESSLKRWCDSGRLPAVRTAGGHRRILLPEAVRFLRSCQLPLVDPTALALPVQGASRRWTLAAARRELSQALSEGDSEYARGILCHLFLQNHTLSAIGDQVVGAAFHDIGDRWECGEVRIDEERRACEICLTVFRELHSWLPEPPSDAPAAVGATPQGDPYSVALAGTHLVLREAGWHAASLGSDVPLAVLQNAVEQRRPALAWLSVSHLQDVDRFTREVAELFEHCLSNGAALAIGGRAVNAALRRRLKCSAFCDSFAALENFAATLSRTNR